MTDRPLEPASRSCRTDFVTLVPGCLSRCPGGLSRYPGACSQKGNLRHDSFWRSKNLRRTVTKTSAGVAVLSTHKRTSQSRLIVTCSPSGPPLALFALSSSLQPGPSHSSEAHCIDLPSPRQRCDVLTSALLLAQLSRAHSPQQQPMKPYHAPT